MNQLEENIERLLEFDYRCRFCDDRNCTEHNRDIDDRARRLLSNLEKVRLEIGELVKILRDLPRPKMYGIAYLSYWAATRGESKRHVREKESEILENLTKFIKPLN